MEHIAHDKLIGLGETAMGGTLASLPLWSPSLDQFINGAHAVAAIGGAFLAIHGIWRILRKRARRSTFSRTREDDL